MLMIRFQRVGRKNDPAFRLVVTPKARRPQTGGLELLGSYHPKTKETMLHGERIRHWLAHGAQPSPTVRRLLLKKGIIGANTGEKSQLPFPAKIPQRAVPRR